MTGRGVFVSLRAAYARGYRPLGAPTVNREIGAMCVRVVDRTGDVALAAMTSDEWSDHVLHAALGRVHARGLSHDKRLGVLADAAVRAGRTWRMTW
jgi:hypothetical protein